ncbi:female sterile (1) Young arrest isoform 1-T1 [Glossina fuscipes fuscipes]
MHIPDDVICKYCQEVFCCDKCRYKHELGAHAIKIRQSAAACDEDQKFRVDDQFHDVKTIFMCCPICENRPLPLKSDLCEEILNHLRSKHLPLKCQKCSKVYQKIDDMKEFSKCVRNKSNLQEESANEVNQSRNVAEASNLDLDHKKVGKTISTQTSPMWQEHFCEIDSGHKSVTGLRYKTKCKAACDELLTDSVSSIKNISSATNSSMKKSSTDKAGKLIRSTSTPVQLGILFAKPREQAFNASGNGQVSSIHSIGCELDNSPAWLHTNNQAVENVNCYRKWSGVRSKMTAITPLRQVMSKSIKKAFVEHGFATAAGALHRDSNYHRMNTPHSPNSSIVKSPSSRPLDLRLSPALRRCQSETEEVLKNQISYISQNKNHNVLLSSQKVTTESIVITRTECTATAITSKDKNIEASTEPCSSTSSSYQSAASSCMEGSIFKSCSSVKIITETTELNQVQFQADTKKILNLEPEKSINNYPDRNCELKKSINNQLVALTPITRIPGALINKKLINFETPLKDETDSPKSMNSSVEMFFTPNATPVRKNSYETLADSDKACKRLLPELNDAASASLKGRGQSTALQDYNDEEKVAKIEKQTKNKAKNQKQSIWSLMSSVIRFPSFKDTDQNETSAETNPKPTLKKCASIAVGTNVQALDGRDGGDIQFTKRKRSNTIASPTNYPQTPQRTDIKAISPTENLNGSPKRFRIQGRRPLDRMLLNKT